MLNTQYWLGIPVVILATFVDTSVFATLREEPLETWLRVLIAFISVTAAVLTSLQTFLRSSERAEKHRIVAARSGSLRHEVEQLLTTGSQQVAEEKLHSLRAELDKLAEDAPAVPPRIWERTKRILDESPPEARAA